MTFQHAIIAAALAATTAASAASARVCPVSAAEQQALLASADPVLAANKRLAYDVVREVPHGGHEDEAMPRFDPTSTRRT